jgi:hypothetical protein
MQIIQMRSTGGIIGGTFSLGRDADIGIRGYSLQGKLELVMKTVPDIGIPKITGISGRMLTYHSNCIELSTQVSVVQLPLLLLPAEAASPDWIPSGLWRDEVFHLRGVVS